MFALGGIAWVTLGTLTSYSIWFLCQQRRSERYVWRESYRVTGSSS